jgi:hypothetical protein
MRLSLARAAAAIALVFTSLASSTDAGAVGTRTFVLDTLDKLSGGDLKGVAVSSDGAVRAGFTLGNAPIPEASASFSALALTDGSTLIGTSPQGKVYKLAGDAVSVFADTGALAVTSMVQAKNGTIYAATIPDGKIFKISQGKADVFATLPETSHVWALVLDRAGTGLFAATGSEGKIFRVEPTGASSVYYRSAEGHLVSLAMMDNGDLLAGSSGKGNLYRVTGPGRATVLATLPGEEVKAVAVSKGIIWAVANEYGEAPEPPKRSPAVGRTPAGPSSSARPKAGKGVLYRFDAQGRPERMMKHDDTHYMSLAVDEQGRPYVGTGANGRVYTVDDAHVVTLLADTDERQIGALFISGGKGFVATSDPPVAHRILGRGGPDAIWTSKVLDATLRAKFGTLSWRSSGRDVHALGEHERSGRDVERLEQSHRERRSHPVGARSLRAGARTLDARSERGAHRGDHPVRDRQRQAGRHRDQRSGQGWPDEGAGRRRPGERRRGREARQRREGHLEGRQPRQRSAPLSDRIQARGADAVARRAQSRRRSHEDRARVGHGGAARGQVPRARRGQ